MPDTEQVEMVEGDPAGTGDGYQWVALANTTAAQFMSQLDGSIVIIARASDLPGHRSRSPFARSPGRAVRSGSSAGGWSKPLAGPC
jgi:hypothetical protein